ncbi:MAG: nucleotide exchange factor GrpE [Beijerinckiaceae bacterium]
MSDPKTFDNSAEISAGLRSPGRPEAGVSADAAAPAAKPGAEASASETTGTEPDPFLVLQSLQRENADLKDRLLRSLADIENMRRRTDREVADAKIYGVTAFARDMLTFADNLRRAVENVPSDLRAQAEAPIKALIEGIELTERDFLSRLTCHGVKKLDPLGAKFDPNMHDALYEVADETKPSGTVIQVVEEGYTIGDRVLRPAKVGVAKGGPKAAN